MGKAILLVVSLSALIAGCSPSSSNPVSGKTQSFNAGQELVAAASGYYSYDYVDSGENCTTGPHQFDQHDQLCQALVNEPLNHYCAWQQRHDQFNNECQ